MRSTFLFMLVICLLASPAPADGGRIAWTGERAGRRAAIVVAPVAPRIGALQIDWIGPSEGGGSVKARHETGILLDAPLVRQGDEWHAVLEMFAEGRWSVRVDPDGDGDEAAIEIPIEIGPAIPEWRTQWPWMFAWVPMVAVGLFAGVRRRAASPRSREGGSRSSGEPAVSSR